MINTNKLYKKDTNPLELVTDIEMGEEYFTDQEGYGIRYINKYELELVHNPVLIGGESMSNLSDKYIDLFWSIVKNTTTELINR